MSCGMFTRYRRLIGVKTSSFPPWWRSNLCRHPTSSSAISLHPVVSRAATKSPHFCLSRASLVNKPQECCKAFNSLSTVLLHVVLGLPLFPSCVKWSAVLVIVWPPNVHNYKSRWFAFMWSLLVHVLIAFLSGAPPPPFTTHIFMYFAWHVSQLSP